MWIARELVRLVARIVVIGAIAFALGGVLALLNAGDFHKNARILLIVLGCFLLAMGGVGSGSNLERFMDTSVQQAAWGNIPGFDAVRPQPGDPRIAPGPALFVSGLVLIAVGAVLL